MGQSCPAYLNAMQTNVNRVSLTDLSINRNDDYVDGNVDNDDIDVK